MPLEIVRDDITRIHADAIVNAANTALQRGGGVCGAIFEAAGAAELQKECDAIGGCHTGDAVITRGCGLPARYIIHTVGPVWQGGSHGEQAQLENCYHNSLELAKRHKLKSVAFPLISSGIFGYPKEQALQVAVTAIGRFLRDNDMSVRLVVYDRTSVQLSEALFGPLEQYVKNTMAENYSAVYNTHPYIVKDSCEETFRVPRQSRRQPRRLDDIVIQLDQGFSQMLMRLIDARGLTDAEVYRRANIDRRLFSKIRGDAGYRVGKMTALALAIALELNLEETRDLLARAGFALSRSQVCDVIIQYFIESGNYDIHEINAALFAYDQPLLVR